MSIIKNYVPAKGICKVTFSYPTTEGVQSVQVLGDFNNWDSKVAPKMKKSKTEFTTAIELAAGKTYEFRYLLNNEQWDNDFNADNYVSAPYVGITNSVLILDAVATSVKASKAVAPKAAPVKKETVKAVKAPVTKPATAKAPKAAIEKAAIANLAKAIAKATTAKATTPKAEVKKEVAKAKPAAAPKSPIAKVVKDDLKKVEGIGPKIAELFIAKGIVTFNDLAKAKVDTLKAILDEGGSKFKMHNPESWPTQAKLAATGKWEELKKLQDELNAGKKA